MSSANLHSSRHFGFVQNTWGGFSVPFQDLGLIPGLSRPGKCDF